MYLSEERLAIANRTIMRTFAQTSVAWQAIPHWDVGDPAQMRIRDDIVDTPGFLNLAPEHEDFQVTLVQTSAPTPDSLLAEVIQKAGSLAKKMDLAVLQQVYTKQGSSVPIAAANTLKDVVEALITARAKIEDDGYRASSCLFTNTHGLLALNDLTLGYPATDVVLGAANVNSLHRVTQIDAAWNNAKTLMLVLGRRQRIAQGGAPDASPGEEPVDLAVSVFPSLEVVGEAANGTIELAVRISYATRVKDELGIVAVLGP
jgi:hypothetical protein